MSKSASRLYISNFADKTRQESIDVLLNRNVFTTSAPAALVPVQVLVCTFNVAGASPRGDLSTWLDTPTAPLVIVIGLFFFYKGLQELVELKVDTVALDTDPRLKAWAVAIARTLDVLHPHTFTLLQSSTLFALGMLIYARKSHVHSVRNVAVQHVKTGFGGIGGNKGGIGLSFALGSTPLLFITAHFAAGLDKTAERARDYATISQGICVHGRSPRDFE